MANWSDVVQSLGPAVADKGHDPSPPSPRRLRFLGFLAALTCTPAGALAADTTPPTIVAPDRNAECRIGGVTVGISPEVTDLGDPLISTRPGAVTFELPFPNVPEDERDPYAYPLGFWTVRVRACDISGNCAIKNTHVVVQDTEAPIINFSANPGSVECTGLHTDENGDTVAGILLTDYQDGNTPIIGGGTVPSDILDPTVSDGCDSSPFLFKDTPPTVLTVGNTSVQASSIDAQGNVGTSTLIIRVADSTAPVIDAAVADFSVAQGTGGEACDSGGGPGTGTLVKLPQPAASDTCSLKTQLTSFWQAPSGGNVSTSPTVCITNGAMPNTVPVTYTVRDNAGNTATDSYNVTIHATATVGSVVSIGTITHTPSAIPSTRYISTQSAAHNVGVAVSGDDGDFAWAVVGATSYSESNETSPPFTAVLPQGAGSEGAYCPLNVTVVDGANIDVDTAQCFGVDSTSPTQQVTTISTTAITASSPGTPATVNASDPNTFPIISHGAKLPLRVTATDRAGRLNSGVRQIVVEVEELKPSDGTPTDPVNKTTVFDRTYAATETTPANLTHCTAAGTCLEEYDTQRLVDKCNQTAATMCTCATVDGNNDCSSSDGRIDVAALNRAPYRLVVTVTDVAGNTSVVNYPFYVRDLTTGLSPLATIATNLIAGSPPGARTPLREAADLLTTADTVFLESPGHAFVLMREAMRRLSAATNQGASADALRVQVGSAVVGEVERMVASIASTVAADVTAGGTATYANDWQILGTTASDDGVEARGGFQSTPRYSRRNFLLQGVRDYLVDVSAAVELAQERSTSAITLEQAGSINSAVSTAITAFDALVMLSRDTMLTNLYSGATANTIDSQPEALFRGSVPGAFGDRIARTVAAQITRFTTGAENGALRGIPTVAVTKMNQVKALIDTFATNVQLVNDQSWDLSAAGFGNEEVVKNIYLTAIQAMEILRDPQLDLVYTYHWQAGLALTLGFVMNFSLYEGPAALTCILRNDGASDFTSFDGCSGTLDGADLGNPVKIYNHSGSGDAANLDTEAQAAECRFGRAMFALSGGRFSGTPDDAVQTLLDSKCLIVNLFNRYYIDDNGVGRFLPNDVAIDPAEYGCTGQAQTLDLAVECPCGGTPVGTNDNNCDGVDNDCDGQVDEDYIATSCGVGACGSTSKCIAGQEVPCEPLVQPPNWAAVDLCDGVDNDCDGTVDDDFGDFAQTCGVGGCTRAEICCSQAMVDNSNENGCTSAGQIVCNAPADLGHEICDGIDNRCDIGVDEGLDNDGDGSGCEPGSGGCVRCDPAGGGCNEGTGATDARLCSGDVAGGPYVWDCNDNDPDVYPGKAEVCDGKDNDCDTVVDENVTNDCGECDGPNSNCSSTQAGSDEGAGGGSSGAAVTEQPFVPNDDNSQTVCVVGVPEGDPNRCGAELNSNELDTALCSCAGGVFTPGNPGTCAGDNAACTTELNEAKAACEAGQSTCETEITQAQAACTTGDAAACTQGYEHLGLPPAGTLLIASEKVNVEFAWVANSSDGTVSRVDTATGNETGRYCAGIRDATKNGDARLCNACNRCFGASRTAVAEDGSVFVGLRWGQGAVTKIANSDDLTNCVDKDSSGTIETSQDLDGDGKISKTLVVNGQREYYGEDDECILFTRVPDVWEGDSAPDAASANASPAGTNLPSLGTGQFTARALAIDADGDVWLGNWRNRGFFELNPTTGLVKRWVYMGIRPYGAVIDGNGILWAPNSCCSGRNVRSVNTGNSTVDLGNQSVWPPYTGVFAQVLDHGRSQVGSARGSYGISVDLGYQKEVPPSSSQFVTVYPVWVGSYPNEQYAAFRLDPGDGTGKGTWKGAPVRATSEKNPVTCTSDNDCQGSCLGDNTCQVITTSRGKGRGVTVDGLGRVWVAQHGGWRLGRVTAYNPTLDNGAVTIARDANNNYLDKFLGNCPSGQSKSTTCADIPIGVGVGTGGKIWTANQRSSNVTAIDPNTIGDELGQPSFHPVGSGPYTYSDFTGNLRKTVTSPSGSYSEIINACPGQDVQEWVRLTWDATLPEGSELRFRVRTAANLLDFVADTAQPWQPASTDPVTPTDLLGPIDPPGSGACNGLDPVEIIDTTNGQAASCTVNANCTTANPSATCNTTLSRCVVSKVLCADLGVTGATGVEVPEAAGSPSVGMRYIEVEAHLVKSTVNNQIPELKSFRVTRKCPQI